jgi:hypothetical protein
MADADPLDSWLLQDYAWNPEALVRVAPRSRLREGFARLLRS